MKENPSKSKASKMDRRAGRPGRTQARHVESSNNRTQEFSLGNVQADQTTMMNEAATNQENGDEHDSEDG